MKTPHNADSSLSNEALTDRTNEQLESVLKNLKETKKILNRDWAQLSPRERSAYSRRVKEMEQEKQSLLEILEMNRLG